MEHRSKLVQWCDNHLVSDWRVAHKMWSVQLDIFVSVGGTIVTLLTLMSDTVQETLGPWKFALIFAAASGIRLCMRLWRQKITGRDDHLEDE